MTPVESKAIGLTAYLALHNNAARNKRNKMRTHNFPPTCVFTSCYHGNRLTGVSEVCGMWSEGGGADTFVRISFVPCLITASLPQLFPSLLSSSLLPKTCKTRTMIITSVQKGNVYCLSFLLANYEDGRKKLRRLQYNRVR